MEGINELRGNTMSSKTMTLSKFFQNYYIIPDYQREYSWQDKQIEDFWEDITSAFEKKVKHYFGTVYLKSIQDGVYEVIDGQQRLTTLFVLLIHLANYDEFWENNIEKDGSWHLTYSGENKKFLEGRIFSNRQGNFSVDNIYKKNLQNLRNLLEDKIKNLSVNEKNKLFEYIKSKLIIDVRYIGNEDGINDMVVFETLNNRGKPLSILEKLKNRLMYLNEIFTDENNKEKVRARINSCWSGIYENLGSSTDEILDEDEFVASHLTIYRKPLWGVFSEDGAEKKLFQMFCSNPTKYEKAEKEDSYYEKIEKSEDLKNPEESIEESGEKIKKYINNLKNFSDAWKKMLVDTSDNIRRIFALDRTREIKVFVATILMKYGEQEQSEIFDLLEKFLFRKSLPNYSGDCDTEMALPTLARKINKCLSDSEDDCFESDNIEADHIKDIIYNALRESIDKDYILEEFKNLYTYRRGNIGFYRWSGIKYFLFKYEEELKKQKNCKKYYILWKDYDEFSVEHIYPQTPGSAWGDLNKEISSKITKKIDCGKKRKIVANSLGNLTLLRFSENASASNGSWKEKCGIYKNKSYDLTAIVQNENWKIETIENRGKNMLKFLATMINEANGGRRIKISFQRNSDALLFFND